MEVACGTGTLLALILGWRRRKNLPQVHVGGIDYAESMLAGAKSRFRDCSWIELQHADAADLPYPEGSFDSANIANSIHCFPDIEGALRDVFRILKPGGTLAANALLYPRGIWPLKAIAERINRWGIREGILYTPYHAEEIRRHVRDAGFEIVLESVSGNCYDVMARKPLRRGVARHTPN
jgi:ubiquinone/menaquinone biosynthesis C-methylase UbiE